MRDELSNLRLGDVEMMLAVVRNGSMTAASRELEVAPSQVSRAVARLEKQLRVQLFRAVPTGVELTEAVIELGPQLEEMVQRLRMVSERAQATGMLTLVAPAYLLPLFIGDIAAALPDVHWRAVEMPDALIHAHSGEGRFDVALTTAAFRSTSEWSTHKVGDLRRGLFARPSFVAQLGPLPLTAARVTALPFITPLYLMNGQLVPGDDGCPVNRRQRRLGCEVDTARAALEIATRVDQVTFTPTVGARTFVRDGRLAEIPVEDWSVSEPLSLICHSDRVLARIQKALATLVATLLEA